jgi:hypothetical protein
MIPGTKGNGASPDILIAAVVGAKIGCLRDKGTNPYSSTGNFHKGGSLGRSGLQRYFSN